MFAPVELILLARGEGIVAIEPRQRIGALAVEDNLKMQVRPENIARDAAVPDDVTLLDPLTALDAIAGQVSVSGLQGHALVGRVLDANHVAIALHSGLGVPVPILRLIYRTILGGVYRALVVGADLGAEVYGLMQAAVVVVPALRQNVDVQRPAQQNLTIRQPHILNPPLPA